MLLNYQDFPHHCLTLLCVESIFGVLNKNLVSTFHNMIIRYHAIMLSRIGAECIFYMFNLPIRDDIDMCSGRLSRDCYR